MLENSPLEERALSEWCSKMEPTFAVGVNIFPQTLIEDSRKSKLIGLDYLAHILHNYLQHGIGTLNLDIQSDVLKIYNYFSVHTMRTVHMVMLRGWLPNFLH
jgi:hypothetical protein